MSEATPAFQQAHQDLMPRERFEDAELFPESKFPPWLGLGVEC